jgi:hypothetical protein
MQHVSGVVPERFVTCSKGIVLECDVCEEKLILVGRESDWRSEGRTSFECGGCGKKLSLEDGW